MKTIWIIDHYSSEPKYGGIARQYDFAVELSKRGYRTIIFSSAFSHYTHTYISKEECFISQFVDNAYYAYVKTAPYEVNGGMDRIKNMFSFVSSVLKSAEQIEKQFGKPDIIEGASVHPLAWIAANKLAKKYKVKFIAEVRDLWPEMWLLNGEKSKFDPMVLFFGAIEKWAYKRADKIIYSMLYGDKYICGKLGFPKDKVALLGQPVDCERYDRQAGDDSKIPEDIKSFISDSFLCVFTGYYMEYEGVYVMLEAAKMLQEKNIPIKMLFVGSGAEADGMKAYAEENDLKNVFVGGRISKEAIPALLRQSDICLAHCASKGSEESFKYGISKNKVNEYMYSKACVIYGRNDENDPVATSGAGFVIKPFDAVAMASKIEEVYKMSPDERQKFGENGCKYVIENHRVDKLVDKLLGVYGY